MKKLYIKLLLIFILLISITKISMHSDLSYVIPHYKQKECLVTIKYEKQRKEVPMNEYLLGVVAGEMPVSFEIEALKAQVVASRTYVMSRNLEVYASTQSQVYLSDREMKEKWKDGYKENKDKVLRAIKETKNEVLTYKGKCISALFFSSSNGQTANSEDYFQGKVEYLKAVDSHWDKESKNNKKIMIFKEEELSKLFKLNIKRFIIESYTKSGYVEYVLINDKRYTGREVREALNLASSCFQIEKESHNYVITTYGNGHAVGMSQYGAQAMAKEKYNYKQILHHYYQNVEIESIDL